MSLHCGPAIVVIRNHLDVGYIIIVGDDVIAQMLPMLVAMIHLRWIDL